jgi:DNA-cytosine methyltransferase
MKVLSLFDGISCARVALKRAGINVEYYYASEINKYAIQISSKNYPDIKHVGSVVDIKYDTFDKCLDINNYLYNADIDLLIGGSPCQDLSIAKAGRKGLHGERSGLFYEYVRIRDEVKPKYFILENVASMSKESRDKISEILGVQPTLINASLVSAQNRKRLFWIGIYSQLDNKYYTVAMPQPEDRNIILKDIIESGEVDRDKSYCIDASYYKGANWKQYKEKGRRQLVIATLDEGTWAKRYEQIRRVYSIDGLAPTIPTAQSGGVMPKIFTGQSIRKLTPIECERLQSLPDKYTEGVSNTQRYKCLGNAFNVDVVAHILIHIIQT